MLFQKRFLAACALIAIGGCSSLHSNTPQAPVQPAMPSSVPFGQFDFNRKIRDVYPATKNKPFVLQVEVIPNRQAAMIAVPPEASAWHWFKISMMKHFLPGNKPAPQNGMMPLLINQEIQYREIYWRASPHDKWKLFYRKPKELRLKAQRTYESHNPQSWQTIQQDAEEFKKKLRQPQYMLGEWKLVAEILATWRDMDHVLLASNLVTAERVVRVSPQAAAMRFDDQRGTIEVSKWKAQQATVDEKQNPIEYLEWKLQQSGKWQPIPATHSQSNPIQLKRYDIVQLRAVRRFPKRVWPDKLEQRVRWRSSEEPNEIAIGSTFEGSLAFGSEPPAHMEIQAEYGAKKKAFFHVEPDINDQKTELSLSVDSSTWARDEIVAGGVGEESTAHLTLDSSHSYGAEKVRLRATYEDGTKAGEINADSPHDDTLYIKGDSFAEAKVLLHAGKRTGKVLVWGEALNNQGKVKSKSNVVKVWFLHPQLDDIRGGEWEYVNGVFQRELTISIKMPNGRPVEDIPVEVSVKPVTPYPINPKASWVVPARGRTGEYGRMTVKQFWKLVPGASLEPDNYQIKTRVLPPDTEQSDNK